MSGYCAGLATGTQNQNIVHAWLWKVCIGCVSDMQHLQEVHEDQHQQQKTSTGHVSEYSPVYYHAGYVVWS